MVMRWRERGRAGDKKSAIDRKSEMRREMRRCTRREMRREMTTDMRRDA